MPRKNYKTITVKLATFAKYEKLVKRMQSENPKIKSMDIVDMAFDKLDRRKGSKK